MAGDDKEKPSIFRRIIGLIPGVASQVGSGDIGGAVVDFKDAFADKQSIKNRDQLVRALVGDVNQSRIQAATNIIGRGHQIIESQTSKSSVEKREERKNIRNANLQTRMKIGDYILSTNNDAIYNIYDNMDTNTDTEELAELKRKGKEAQGEQRKLLKAQYEQAKEISPYKTTWQDMEEPEIEQNPSAFDKVFDQYAPKIVEKIPTVGKPLAGQIGKFKESISSIGDCIANIRAGTRTDTSWARIVGIGVGTVLGGVVLGSLGAAGASFIPGVGTAAGGAAGVAAGVMLGASMGGKIGEKIVDVFSNFDPKMKHEKKYEMDYTHLRNIRKAYGLSEDKILMMHAFVVNRTNVLKINIKQYQKILAQETNTDKRKIIKEKLSALTKQKDDLDRLYHKALEMGRSASLQKLCVYFLEHEKVARHQVVMLNAKCAELNGKRAELLAKVYSDNATNDDNAELENITKELHNIENQRVYIHNEQRSLCKMINEFRYPNDKKEGVDYDINIYDNIKKDAKSGKAEVQTRAKKHLEYFRSLYTDQKNSKNQKELIQGINEYKNHYMSVDKADQIRHINQMALKKMKEAGGVLTFEVGDDIKERFDKLLKEFNANDLNVNTQAMGHFKAIQKVLNSKKRDEKELAKISESVFMLRHNVFASGINSKFIRLKPNAITNLTGIGQEMSEVLDDLNTYLTCRVAQDETGVMVQHIHVDNPAKYALSATTGQSYTPPTTTQSSTRTPARAARQNARPAIPVAMNRVVQPTAQPPIQQQSTPTYAARGKPVTQDFVKTKFGSLYNHQDSVNSMQCQNGRAEGEFTISDSLGEIPNITLTHKATTEASIQYFSMQTKTGSEYSNSNQKGLETIAKMAVEYAKDNNDNICVIDTEGNDVLAVQMVQLIQLQNKKMGEPIKNLDFELKGFEQSKAIDIINTALRQPTQNAPRRRGTV